MDRLEQKPIARYLPLLTAAALNLAVLLLMLCIGRMRFGTNDDRDISNLLANVTGANNGQYIHFMNILFTAPMTRLYAATGNVTNWYVLLSVIFSFAALTCISECIIRRSANRWIGLALAAVVSAWCAASHYIIFQFTQNAALYAMTGVLLLCDEVIHGKRRLSPLSLAIGIFFLLLGSLIRFQSLYFAAPYLGLILGYEILFRENKARFLPWLRERRFALIALAAAVLLVLSARSIHLGVYRSDPELNDFMNQNAMRAELLDYGVPDYSEHKEAYNRLGLIKNDVILFSRHTCIDREVFSRDVIKAMVEMKDVKGTDYSFKNLSLSAFPAVWASFTQDVPTVLLWGVLAVVLLFFLFCTSRRRLPVVIVSLLLPFGMIWYFVSVDRMPYRVWYSIVLPALVTVVYACSLGYKPLSERKPRSFGRVAHIAGLVLLCLAALASAGSSIREATDDSAKVTDSYEQILDFAQAHPDTLVLLDRPAVSPLTYSATITPMTCLANGSHSNICYQGGWICWTPQNQSVLKNFGADNPYRAIADGMPAYLIDSNNGSSRKLDFIRRHYNKNAALEQIGTIRGTKIGIYRLYLPEP